MPGVMPYSHWLELLGKTISMLPISRRRRTERQDKLEPQAQADGRSNGGQQSQAPQAGLRRNAKTGSNSAKPILGPEASVELRDRLLAES